MNKSRYSVYEAKTRLSEILRQVRQNRTVVITDRGKDAARVVSLEEKTSLKKRLEALERAGTLQSNPGADPSKIRMIARRPGALREFLEHRNRY